MFRAHIPIVIYALFVVLFAAGTLFFTSLFSFASPGDPEKFLPDEARSEKSDSRNFGSMRPFLLMMLFVVLGVEATFLILWARLYRTWLSGHLVSAFFSLIVFTGILFVGYIWVYKKDALNWE